MSLPTNKKIAAWVADHIGEFHDARLEKLKELDLRVVLARKNPYLFKAKNVLTAEELVRGLLDAHLSSQEETMFGGFLEELAVWINGEAFAGRKSSTTGIDLEFDRDDVRYLVAIKSGPNWANSEQIARMRDSFKRAAITARTNRSKLQVRAVNGCCYGRNRREDKGDYLKLCGQSFWAFIGGSESLYIDIIEPLGHQAHAKNVAFAEEYGRVITRMTRDVISDFCDVIGNIAWPALLQFNSGRDLPLRRRGTSPRTR